MSLNGAHSISDIKLPWLFYGSVLSNLTDIVIKFMNVCETVNKCLGHSKFCRSLTTSDKRCLSVCTTTFIHERCINVA